MESVYKKSHQNGLVHRKRYYVQYHLTLFQYHPSVRWKNRTRIRCVPLFFFVHSVDTVCDVCTIHDMSKCDWLTRRIECERGLKNRHISLALYIARGFLYCNTLCAFFIRNKMASQRNQQKTSFFLSKISSHIFIDWLPWTLAGEKKVSHIFRLRLFTRNI